MAQHNHSLSWGTAKKADGLLLLLYLAFVAAILFRVQVERTGYLSPDSEAYLQLAQNLLDGHGFYVLNEAGDSRHYFSTWPVGYPVLIFILAKLTGLSVFWASKALNLLLLGFSFLLLRNICRTYAFLLAAAYGAYTFMEVYSFTWSEAPFLFGILVLSYTASRAFDQARAPKYAVAMLLTCLLLFLVRYAGAFAFAVPGLLGLYFLYNRNIKAGVTYTMVTILLAILAGTYLYINYTLSGYTTGFNRLEAPTENIGDFAAMLLQGVGNELLIIRKYRSASQPDFLLYATALVQAAVLVYCIATIRKAGVSFAGSCGNGFSLACFAIAGLYFVAILVLRHVSYFDALDYRLLSPTSFLALMGLLYALAKLPEHASAVKRTKYVIFGFFLLSLLLNLPKEYLLEQLR